MCCLDIGRIPVFSLVHVLRVLIYLMFDSGNGVDVGQVEGKDVREGAAGSSMRLF
jgi:hypothetical protein